eukprot:5874808-Amphidinium_carterae.2
MAPVCCDAPCDKATVLSFYVFFTTAVMLNIITGIFVEQATREAHKDKDELGLLRTVVSAVSGVTGDNTESRRRLTYGPKLCKGNVPPGAP